MTALTAAYAAVSYLSLEKQKRDIVDIDLADFLLSMPYKLTLAVVQLPQKKTLYLGFQQGLSYSLMKEVFPLSAVDLPKYEHLYTGRVLGQAFLQKLMITPVEEPETTNLSDVFSSTIGTETLLDKDIALILREDTQEAKIANSLRGYYEGKEAFTENTLKEALKTTLSEMLPIVSYLMGWKTSPDMEKMPKNVIYLAGKISHYSTQATEQDLIIMESMAVEINEVGFPARS
ncbi:MAG: hypothetical protein GXO39_04240 [Thermotogae bacterium]|nr:hypothetical protein [Thermotogota bacterium]